MTLVEVAKKAGVSKTTVSAILNKDPSYSYRPETVDRVLRSAKAIGYRRHSTASLMRAKRTYMIGIFAANLRGSCAALMTDALINELKRHQPYKPMFIDPAVLREDDSAAFGFELLEGLFWSLPRRDDDLLRSLLERPDAPQVVTLGHKYPGDLPVSSVLAGLGDGGYQAADHLLKLGHERIAIIYRAPQKDNDRFAGYRRAMKAHGAAPVPTLELAMPEDYGADCYFRAGLELTLQAFEGVAAPPTAILCHNDETALGVLKAARRLGLRVPKDLSVVGFDGVPLAEYSEPPLATIEQPLEQEATAAVELMLARLKTGAQEKGELRKLACTLRVGESSAPPKK